jgi:heme A synthase
VIPRTTAVVTLIEYSHRLTSGLALLGVLALMVWTWRVTTRGHPARVGAALSFFFILTEAAVGAGLVLFRLVADNATMARAMFMAAHLMNTFVLIACLTVTASWLSGGDRPTLRPYSRTALVMLGALALLVTGTSGAVAALGDTLFPAASLGAALSADMSATSHVLIRLRVLHPALAVTTALAIAAFGLHLSRPVGIRAQQLAKLLVLLISAQVAAGFANVLLLAPVWMQLIHLALADLVWITYVLLAAETLSAPERMSIASHAA